VTISLKQLAIEAQIDEELLELAVLFPVVGAARKSRAC